MPLCYVNYEVKAEGVLLILPFPLQTRQSMARARLHTSHELSTLRSFKGLQLQEVGEKGEYENGSNTLGV